MVNFSDKISSDSSDNDVTIRKVCYYKLTADFHFWLFIACTYGLVFMFKSDRGLFLLLLLLLLKLYCVP
jgi:hypothetical protein